MRINKYLAAATGMSRRAADTAITNHEVTVNGVAPLPGQDITPDDTVLWKGKHVQPIELLTIMLNKPVGYVCSREGQGSQTIYNLLPQRFHHLKPVGRLDKNSSGLILLTNDGTLANELTHPRYAKTKVYEVTLNQPLEPLHHQMIQDHGIQLEDGPSRLQLEKKSEDATRWTVRMQEGRNRQIRRTFAALNYDVIKLHRTTFGDYTLGTLRSGHFNEISDLSVM
jgi:23S rRNA pseudouridine2605 synthase